MNVKTCGSILPFQNQKYCMAFEGLDDLFVQNQIVLFKIVRMSKSMVKIRFQSYE